MGKKKKCPEFENHERWLVSYADMLTLLFAVFVVLFALKEGGEPQVQKTAGSMQESFNTPLEDIPIDRRTGPMQQGFGIFEHFRGSQSTPPGVKSHVNGKSGKSVVEVEFDSVKKEIEDRLYGPDRFRQTQKTGHSRIVSVERTKNGFKFKLMARYFFKANSVKIDEKSHKELSVIVGILKNLGRNVRVEGHTDSKWKTNEYNLWDISALRASRMIKYMIESHQFPQTRLMAAGLADIKPIAHNGTEAGRSLNRRLEFHVNYDFNELGDEL